MRIPLYQSKLMATNEAPGRAFQTRKRAEPFIQSALRQASVGQALSSSIGGFALHRYNMAEQLKLDEATIEGQNALRQLAFDYTKDGNPESVLDGDNPRWFSDVSRIRKGLLKKLGKNRNSLQKFNASFNIAESNQRFSLRNAVSSSSRTKQDKLNNAKFDAAVIALSGLGDKPPSEAIASYNAAMLLLETDLQGQIDKGLTDDNYKIVAINTANKEIAENVIKAWANNDPLKVLSLSNSYNDTTGKLELPEGSEYLNHILKKLNNDVSLEVIETAQKESLDHVKMLDDLDQLSLKIRENVKSDFVKNYFAIKSTDQFTSTDIENLLPGYKELDQSYELLVAKAFAKVQEQGRDYFTGEEAQSLIIQMVNNPLRGITVSDDVRIKMDKAFLGNVQNMFVSESDSQNVKNQAKNNFYKAKKVISNGNISIMELYDFLESGEYPGGFMQGDFASLENAVQSHQSNVFNLTVRALKSKYKIIGEKSSMDAFADQLESAFSNVHDKLLNWYVDNQSTADLQAIETELNSIMKQVSNEQSQDFMSLLRSAMREYNGQPIKAQFPIDGSIADIRAAMAARMDEVKDERKLGGLTATHNANIRGLLEVIEMLGGTL